MKLKFSLKLKTKIKPGEVKYEITFKVKMRWDFTAFDLMLNLLGIYLVVRGEFMLRVKILGFLKTHGH